MITAVIDTSVVVALFDRLLDGLLTLIPQEAITWVSNAGKRLFPEILALCREHQGKLNYHDALIALACRELGVGAIISFDTDFDAIVWLERVSDPANVMQFKGNS